MKRTKPSHDEAQERLLATCSRLFYTEGMHAVGVDRIASESGIAKMTLYRHFSSKDHLIGAWLSDRDSFFWNWYRSEVDGAGDQSPRGRLAAGLNAVEQLSKNPACFGCVFQLTAGEFPDTANLAHQRAAEHKRAFMAWIATETDKLGLPPSCANGLYLLVEGVWSSVRMFGQSEGPQSSLVEVGLRLIDSYLDGH